MRLEKSETAATPDRCSPAPQAGGIPFTDKQANRALSLKQKLLLFLREVTSRVKNRIALTGAPLQSRLFLDTILLEI